MKPAVATVISSLVLALAASAQDKVVNWETPHVHPLAHALEVERVPAAARREGVDRRHLGAELHQTPHGAAPDEAESPGHERAPSCQAGAELAAHFWIRRSTISSHQSRPRPRATCPTRLKLKNCERPCSRW